MSIAVTNTTKIAVETEVTEGTYVAPSGASSYLQTLASGLEVKFGKELLTRDVFTGSIGSPTPRTGTRSVSGTIPVECRAFSTEGSAPEFDKLLKAALGTRRQNTTTVTSKASGNTASVVQIEDADISKFNVGDVVRVNMAGAHHMSPISAKSSGAGTATITLKIPHPSGDITDSATISKFTTYTVAESGHSTFSMTRYIDGAVEDKAFGCRVTSVSLSDFATGKMPKLTFGFEGLDFARDLNAPAHTPSFDTALPPIALDAKLYADTGELIANELQLSIENTVSFATSFSYENGKGSSRITKRTITGSINPYMDTTSIANYEKFRNNTEFSLFAYAKNPTSTEGEFENVVAIYMPKCIITEFGDGDADGLTQETISFTAGRGSDGTTNEIYICFI